MLKKVRNEGDEEENAENAQNIEEKEQEEEDEEEEEEKVKASKTKLKLPPREPVSFFNSNIYMHKCIVTYIHAYNHTYICIYIY